MGVKGQRWRKRLSLAERLEKYSEPEPNSGCVLWTGYVNRYGYGQLGVWDSETQTHSNEVAHRAAYRLYVGPLAAGDLVCHRCDTPPCINPAHLFKGTPMDNTHDMIRKGRRVTCPGERHGMAKLTRDDVLKIAAHIRAGENQYRIAAAFGIRQNQVSRIKNGQTWRWLLNPLQVEVIATPAEHDDGRHEAAG